MEPTVAGRLRLAACLTVVVASCAVLPFAAPAGAAQPVAARDAATALHVQIDEGFRRYAGLSPLDDGDRFGPWRVVFDGNDHGPGLTVVGRALQMQPQASRDASQTNAALVVSRERFRQSRLHLNATWVTRASTRVGQPNPWEVGWLVWDYLDNGHFTYLILKPNGWEVGRRDPSQPGGQRFISDGPEPMTALGMPRTASVDRVGAETTIRVDGQVLLKFALPAAERRGSVGMYCEDSVVDWSHVFVATSA